MSRINGDKARYQKMRKRTLKTRERTRALVAKAQEHAKAQENVKAREDAKAKTAKA